MSHTDEVILAARMSVIQGMLQSLVPVGVHVQVAGLLKDRIVSNYCGVELQAYQDAWLKMADFDAAERSRIANEMTLAEKARCANEDI